MNRLLSIIVASVCLLTVSLPAAEPSRFNIRVEGSGPDVILIPGLASSPRVWDATTARLKATHRCHLIHVAGFAGAPVAGNHTGIIVAPLAEEIAGYITEQGLKSPAIIGHSLGGVTALMLAARHPEVPGRVLVVDALPFFPLAFNAQATAATMRPFADMVLRGLQAMNPAQFVESQQATLSGMVKDEKGRARATADLRASDQGATARGIHELLTTDLRSELGAIVCPLTVLYASDPSRGASTAAADETFKAAYANAHGVRLQRMDNSLHFIMDDQPDRFAEAVDEFFR